MVKWSKVGKMANDIVNWGGPPAGMVPIGGSGFYKTPTDKPVSPTDCNAYPDSIFCGGNPFSPAPVGLKPSISVNECAITGSVKGILFFNKLPTFSVSYIRPECRDSYGGKPPPPPLKTPPTAGKRIGFNRPYIDGDREVYAFIVAPYPNVQGGTLITPVWSDIRCPGEDVKQNPGSTVMSSTYVSATITVTGPSKWGFKIAGGDVTEIQINAESGKVYRVTYESGEQRIFDASVPPPYVTVRESSPRAHGFYYYGIYKGNWNHIVKLFESLEDKSSLVPTTFSMRFDIICTAVIASGCKRYNPGDFNPPPLADYNIKKDCCMQCCDNGQQTDNSDLLKQILAEIQKANKSLGTFPVNATLFDANENEQEAQASTIQIGSVAQSISRTIERVEKIAKIIGIDALPLTVPDSICDPVNDGILENIWDALTPDATRKINNLFEWNVWMLEQFSAVMGHWQMEIEVASEKPKATEGEEQPPTPAPKKIVIPDIRSCLKELLMLNIQQYKIQGLILDVALKDLTETASTKKEVVATQLNLKEIVEFLDYQTDQDYVDVPMQISVPGKDLSDEDQNDLKKFLEPTSIPVRYEKWNGKKSLSDLFIHLATLMRR
jgi:hypothetical protein